MNTVFGNFPIYAMAGIVLPLLYGSWRAGLYNFGAGPLAAYLLTSNVNEQPAVWCLLSIGLLLLVIKTPIRNYLHVTWWFWWPREKASG